MTSSTKTFLSAVALSLAGHSLLLGLAAFSTLERNMDTDLQEHIRVHLAAPGEPLQADEKSGAAYSHTTDAATLSTSTIDHQGRVGGIGTISMNDPPEAWHEYLLRLRERIDGTWRYPSDIFCSDPPCIAVVVFSITRDGRCVDTRILQSAGTAVLDEESLRAVRSAAPYEKLPDMHNLNRLNVVAEFHYGETE